MKQKMDIEKLLQWAYREELPKQGAREGDRLPGFESNFAKIELGTRVDVSRRPFDLVDRDPHPDAIIIANAVRSLEPIMLGATECAAILGEYAALDTYDRLGDSELARNKFPRPVVKAMAGAEWDARNVIVLCARRRTRPVFEIGTPHPFFHLAPHTPLVYGREPSTGAEVRLKGGIKREESYWRNGFFPRCLLEWGDPEAHGNPTLGQLLEARIDDDGYAVWHRALTLLSKRLSVPGVLAEHDPTGPEAPPMPWVAPKIGDPEIKGRTSGVADPLPFASRRQVTLDSRRAKIERERRNQECRHPTNEREQPAPRAAL